MLNELTLIFFLSNQQSLQLFFFVLSNHQIKIKQDSQMANRSSLAEKFQNNINKCDICYSQYNRNEKQPVIICSMHHTICRECMSGLEVSRKCPYCRENINFGKIVVNNYIFELLPNDPAPPAQPNTRVEIRQPQPVQFQPPPSPMNYAPQQPVMLQQPVSINYQPQQPVYPPNYYPQNNNNFQPHQGYDPIDDIFYEERPFDTSDCWGSIKGKLQLYSSDRAFLYCFIFILQFPFLFFDFYFSKTGTDPACYDTPYGTKAYILRPWLLAMGICEATFMASVLFADLLRICGLISHASLQCAEYTVLAFMVLKFLLWMYMEITIFAYVIAPHCSGGVFAYGVFQTVIHGLILLILFCVSQCK